MPSKNESLSLDKGTGLGGGIDEGDCAASAVERNPRAKPKTQGPSALFNLFDCANIEI